MTKKDFTALAKLLLSLKPSSSLADSSPQHVAFTRGRTLQWEHTVIAITKRLQASNKAFDAAKFQAFIMKGNQE